MRQVIVVCRSAKRARTEVASVLDSYFHRIGDRTWRGKASNECISRVSHQLKKVASRYMAVAMYEERPDYLSQSPLFVIGSKSMFGDRGSVPVATRNNESNTQHSDSKASELMYLIVRLSGLFHDVGKQALMFDYKLKSNIIDNKSEIIADPIRHEFVSFVYFDEFVRKYKQLQPIDAEHFHELWGQLPNLGFWNRLLSMHGDGSEGKRACIELDLLKSGVINRYSAAALLILTHHKLPFSNDFKFFTPDRYMRHIDENEILKRVIFHEFQAMNDNEFNKMASDYIKIPRGYSSNEIRKKLCDFLSKQDNQTKRKDFLQKKKALTTREYLKNYGLRYNRKESLFSSDAWRKAVLQTMKEIEEIEEDLDPIAIQALDLYMRTSMMIGDHMGSAASRVSDDQELAIRQTLANTIRTEDGIKAADTLLAHTTKVTSFSGRVVNDILKYKDRLPSISEKNIPSSIREPMISDNENYAWQGRTANVVADMVQKESGGFFGVIRSGTGTGKTRGAPTVLATAALNDFDESRRQLRFNLALGLRVLARQSGHEYVNELNFGNRDIAIMTGLAPLDIGQNYTDAHNSKASIDDNEMGSDDNRLAELEYVDVEYVQEHIPEEDTEAYEAWLKNLSLDLDQKIPVTFSRMIENSRKHKAKLKKLIATPIIAMTLDHIMPVASPVKSSFLGPAIRVLSSDTIIDEIDSFSEECLSAICRLAYYVGLSGRRLIIMSATLEDIAANAIYKNYALGYSDYSRLFKKPSRIHTVVSGEIASSMICKTIDADSADEFRNMFEESSSYMTHQKSSLRHSVILKHSGDIESIASAVSEQIDIFHKEHGTRLLFNDGQERRVSVGFVKVTRIKQLVSLASHMDENHERFLGKDITRKYIILHSQMPRIQRESIEIFLAKLLNRKNTRANNNFLRKLIENPDSVVDYKTNMDIKDDIQIVVLCSPVIETGNDLDFDYGIIDPSSTRSVVQCAGRVNRHRRHLISSPNIALFAMPLNSIAKGKVAYPGVETDVPKKVGLGDISIDCPDRMTINLLPEFDDAPISNSIFYDKSLNSPLLIAEKKKLSMFLDPQNEVWELESYSKSMCKRLTEDYFKARQFRRKTDYTLDFYIDYYSAVDFKIRHYGPQSDKKRIDAVFQAWNIETYNFDNLLFPTLLEDLMAAREQFSHKRSLEFLVSISSHALHGSDKMSFSSQAGLLAKPIDILKRSAFSEHEPDEDA